VVRQAQKGRPTGQRADDLPGDTGHRPGPQAVERLHVGRDPSRPTGRPVREWPAVGRVASEGLQRVGTVDEPDTRTRVAALLKNEERKGKRCAVILSGGNIDREMYLEALNAS